MLIPYVRWGMLPWREEDHLALWVPYVSTMERGTILYGVRPVLSSFIYRRECDTIPRVSDTTDTSARYVESPNDSDPPCVLSTRS